MKEALVESTLNQHQRDIRNLWEEVIAIKNKRLSDVEAKVLNDHHLEEVDKKIAEISRRLDGLETRMKFMVNYMAFINKI